MQLLISFHYNTNFNHKKNGEGESDHSCSSLWHAQYGIELWYKNTQKKVQKSGEWWI